MELFRNCTQCGKSYPIADYCKVRSKFFNGSLPICNTCLDSIIRNAGITNNWNKVNKLCQWADVPFLPAEWIKVYNGNISNWFAHYCRIFGAKEFETIDWSDYNDEYIKLQARDELMDEVPGYIEKKYELLRKKWGTYCDEELDALEELFNETMATQNVTTGNQIDQLKKICKTSLLIDQRIAEGQPYKDLMDSYEKLIKASDLTPKNTKNSNDFDSVGEVYDYLESIGWINKFYDGAKRDEVDEIMKNVQNWTRKLCIGESTLTEEILQKINNLTMNENDSTDYDSFDYDMYDKEATDILSEQDIEVEMDK